MKRLFVLSALLPLMAAAQPSQAPLPADQRTQWFRDAKFGMFIHWGPYSVLGRHEWSRHMLQIPQAEYDKYALAFNPVNFNADTWVDIAKNAGAKYMVITSKHHDGFSIFRSQVSSYDIELTKYQGDPLKMLADSARRKDMRLGFYHSIMDWHHPDYLPKRDWEVPGQKPGGNIDKYIEYMKGQIRELLTGYGDVATMWFDGEWEHTIEEMHSDEIYDFIRELQPNALINDRLYKRKPGNRADYGTPEQFVPATGVSDPSGKPVLWESCVTINTDSWGYNKYETDFKTSRDLIRMLVEVVSKGGNLLLNVGPQPDGTIQPEFVTRLAAIGNWMKVNGEAIYGTTASPFSRLPFFGRVTVKNDNLYLHVFQWPADRRLRIPNLENKVRAARLLATPNTLLDTARDGSDIVVTLPESAPDDTASVVRLELDGPPKVAGDYIIRPDTSGTLRLGAESSEIETEFEQRAKKENLLGHVYITRWTRWEDKPAWIIDVPKDATYEVVLSYGANASAEKNPFVISSGSGRLTGFAKRTPNELVFRATTLGKIKLKAGRQSFQIGGPQKGRGPGITLESIVLRPLT
jgi:alpha-L-fucosidase